MLNNPSLLELATRIAVKAHEHQTRKESNIPYIVHPFMVALKLQKYGFSDEVLSAALVHDVLEDTNVTADEIEKSLGFEIRFMVETVTQDSGISWKDKKIKYIEKVRVAPVNVRAIATADKIHNLESLIVGIKEHGESIWQNFNSSKVDKIWFEESMLKMLRDTWEHPLVDEYESLLVILKNKI